MLAKNSKTIKLSFYELHFSKEIYLQVIHTGTKLLHYKLQVEYEFPLEKIFKIIC